jgi:hypothetical protein
MKQFDLNNDPKIESGFKVPENYFEQFEAKVMAKLVENEKKVKVISIFKQKKFWYPAVAAILIIGILIPMYLNHNKENQFSTSDYLAYENTITTDDIAENLTDEDITAIEKSLQLNPQDTKTYVDEYVY